MEECHGLMWGEVLAQRSCEPENPNSIRLRIPKLLHFTLDTAPSQQQLDNNYNMVIYSP